MVHTLPDYTSKWKTKTISAIADNAELAARLGSIVSFDRRGNVSWIDDFEAATLRWNAVTVGGGGTGALSTTHARGGDSSVKLVTAATTNRGFHITVYLPMPTSTRMGVEFSFATDDADWFLNCIYSIDDRIQRKYMGLTWTESTDTIAVYDQTGLTTPVMTNAKSLNDAYMFHTIKLVSDFSTNDYMRLLWDDIETDLTAYHIYRTVTADTRFATLDIAFTTKENVAKTCYIDNVITTMNEA